MGLCLWGLNTEARKRKRRWHFLLDRDALVFDPSFKEFRLLNLYMSNVLVNGPQQSLPPYVFLKR